jgi:molybdenum cofactor cytidylyltransferase
VTDDGLPVHDAERVAAALAALDPDEPPAPTVVGVLLAGGTSSRFGDANKLRAELDGEPLVRHAARTLLDADLHEVVVVTGHEAGAVRAALADLPVRFVHNPAYEAGLSTSVARGVRAVTGADDADGGGGADDADGGGGADVDAAVFLPGDMPAVEPSTVRRLVDARRAGLGTALAAAHDGRRGNPVLFDRRHFEDLLDVEGDVGGRPVLVGSDDAALVATDDPGVVVDVDTVADLRRRR